VKTDTPLDLWLALRGFPALLARDIVVLRREMGFFLARTLMQPLLLLFVFTSVFPRIGQSVGGKGGAAAFSTLLVGGTMASAMLFQGIQAVALPLVQDFGYTREIEDRVLAPLPLWAIAVQKICSGAIQALIAALIVLPLAAFIPATPVHLDVNWAHIVFVLPLCALLSASLGLAVGTRAAPRHIPLIFSLVVVPMTFLGAVYYPWTALEPLPWLKLAVLLNPLVYLSEGLRMALTTDLPHMHPATIYGALCGFTLVLGWLGIQGFRRRVLS
jgi:ABC-2 type transport system permease protein